MDQRLRLMQVNGVTSTALLAGLSIGAIKAR